MKVSIVAHTRSHMDVDLSNMMNDLKSFSGAMAGICYMSDKYHNSYVTDYKKALKRFSTVAKTGHHSIAGHAQITILLEGVPKIVAMYLNNLKDYECSEKSGRYTSMTGTTEIENELYNKWILIFEELITKDNSSLDSKLVHKLAMENARYLLSVFTPTTMSYTTSLRQWNYIIDWLEVEISNNKKDTTFTNNLCNSFLELREKLVDLVGVDELRDIKNRKSFSMLSPIEPASLYFVCTDTMYRVKYEGSFAQLAQAQRHRTLHYHGYFDGTSKKIHVPAILTDTKYYHEWMNDFGKVQDLTPMCTAITIVESGHIDDFFLKAQERNCGRAQLEIMQQTLKTAEFINKQTNNMYSEYFHPKSGCPKMKGQINKCLEPCAWGCEVSRSKKI